jgi:hypothetical protein
MWLHVKPHSRRRLGVCQNQENEGKTDASTSSSNAEEHIERQIMGTALPGPNIT